MKILVINSGSSSLKCTLFQMPERRPIADALVERIGEGDAEITFDAGPVSFKRSIKVHNHSEALDAVLGCLQKESGGALASLDEIGAVGHRVVHGGEKFSSSVAVDEDVIRAIRENFELAPLHNPPNLLGIEASMERLKGRLQVAVFDTAFHETMPRQAYLYALPYELYEKHHIRRYGFHGISHRYVAEKAAQMLSKHPQQCNLITLHLGNGCSATAVKGGKSVDTSMGLTPLEGLAMGTRVGDADPTVIFYLMEKMGMSPQETHDLLNRRSGLAGMSGVGNDMRKIIAAAQGGNERAELAIEVFCYRAKKYIGAYLAALGGADGIVFTAGIGENSPEIRRRICQGLESLGICLDDKKNRAAVGREAIISSEQSRVAVMVVPTDEALMIAIDTYEIYLQSLKHSAAEAK
jgi:acetate kinase